MCFFSKKIAADKVKATLPQCYSLIFDRYFKLPEDAKVRKEIARFIKKRGKFDYNVYHDCDNAAVELLAHMSGKGWPFAICIIPGHAINCYINSDLEVKYIEPQTGEEVETPKHVNIVIMM